MLPSQKSEIPCSVSLWQARQLFPETKTRLHTLLNPSSFNTSKAVFGYENRIENKINLSLNFQSTVFVKFYC